jgi:anti-sigma factor ChrR (cupin superfamily)
VEQDSGSLLRRSLTDFLSFAMDEAALARLSWRDFGNGLSMARLARKDQAELVLYRIAATAAADAFLKHEHLGGELYLVLKGGIADETGVYEQGELVFLAPHSVHTPRAVGETIVLVFWPAGVRIVE